MNRLMPTVAVLAGVAMVVAACGRAPEPSSSPSSYPLATVPTSAAGQNPLAPSTAPTSAGTLPTSGASTRTTPTPVKTTAKQPVPPPPTSAKPAPPPPEPPDRWVLSAADRRSLEQQTGAPFTGFPLTDFYSRICPKHNVCIRTAFQVDAGLGHEDEDCWVDHNIIPDPLFEDGTVTWVVNNLCDPPS